MIQPAKSSVALRAAARADFIATANRIAGRPMSYQQAELATELLLELLTGWCPVAAPWLKSDMVDVRLPHNGEPDPQLARRAALAAAAAQLAAHCHRSPVAMKLAETHLAEAVRLAGPA